MWWVVVLCMGDWWSCDVEVRIFFEVCMSVNEAIKFVLDLKYIQLESLFDEIESLEELVQCWGVEETN